MLKRVQHDRLVCYILVNLFITLILLCHPEFTVLLVADNRRLTREGARRVFQGLTNWIRKLQDGKMLKRVQHDKNFASLCRIDLA